MATRTKAAAGRDLDDSVVDVVGVSRRFGSVEALHEVSLHVEPGEIHALLGPNGAGKTTLVRILSGLVEPGVGEVRVLGIPWNDPPREAKQLFGLVPSGDRSLYLRLSGLENLIFFARLYGLRRRDAKARALRRLLDVGLEDAGNRRVMTYSHGMQKRLSVARGLLMDPPLLFVDEATHDLDPEGARRIRGLVAAAAERGVGVLWATQRIEEIRGFARTVTVLDRGTVRFAGTVQELLAIVPPERFVLQVRTSAGGSVAEAVGEALAGLATVVPMEDHADHVLIGLADGVILGTAIRRLAAASVDVLSCREERSDVEEAFLHLIEANDR
jgi:ABC-2 type transport system ATP-binding protein